MATTPKIRRLSREDFKEAPSWIEQLIWWLDQFLDFVVLAFNHNITFSENIQCLVKTFTVQAGATPDLNTFSFPWELPRVPSMLFAGKIIEQSTGNFVVLTNAVSVFWRYENGTIYIMSIPGLTDGKFYDVTVLVI